MKIKLKDLETTLSNIAYMDKTFRYSLKMANKKTVAMFMFWYTSYPEDVVILRNTSLDKIKLELNKRVFSHELRTHKSPPFMEVLKLVHGDI
jgi:hypothetical protein